MSKKNLLIILFSLSMGLTALTTSAYVLTEGQRSTPAYLFASDRHQAGDIFYVDTQNRIHRLTHHPAADWDPIWATDGSQNIAFTSQRSGNSDIWLLTGIFADNQQPPLNITQHPAWDYSPSFSPSGHSIAFVSERDGDAEIFSQHLEEQEAIQLTFNEGMDHQPAWSPDGQWIAFAAVRDGVERIYRILRDGTDEQVLLPPQMQGNSPAWSPDGQQLAFVGWGADYPRGIYVLDTATGTPELRYAAQTWLGSLDWSGDGAWLAFTAWTAGDHDGYALSLAEGTVHQLTQHPMWDDFVVVHPTHRLKPQVLDDKVALEPRRAPFELGMNIADLGKAHLIRDLDYGWGKGYLNWATVESSDNGFSWTDPDNVVQAFEEHRLEVLMRIHGTPDWAKPANTAYTHPPTNLTDFGEFMTAVARRYKGRVAAYEIWNEPNLYYEWGNGPPNPAQYTALLKTAYQAIKAVDPNAIVVSGGLSTTGDGSATAYGDLQFLQGMYDAGARGYFDAMGSHPYTFGKSPDEVDPYGLSLWRVAEQHAVMTANGDGDTPIWITEVGWVLNSSWHLGEHDQSGVDPLTQAEYLVQAQAKIAQEWPFVEAVFPFNLDFSTVSWYPADDPMRWYAILNPDRTPRPAFSQLKAHRNLGE